MAAPSFRQRLETAFPCRVVDLLQGTAFEEKATSEKFGLYLVRQAMTALPAQQIMVRDALA